jgi:hypothetical protein
MIFHLLPNTSGKEKHGTLKGLFAAGLFFVTTYQPSAKGKGRPFPAALFK